MPNPTTKQELPSRHSTRAGGENPEGPSEKLGKRMKMKNKKKSVKDIVEGIWHWICLALVVASVIYIVFKITINHIKRKHIENDPVETEAVLTKIGQGSRHVGQRIYYDYYAGDSLYHGNAIPGTKKVKQMAVGQTIKITYEKAHPSNSMYERCVSQ